MKIIIKCYLTTIFIFVFTIFGSGQQPSWMPTIDFPTPGALNVYSLGSNYGWCDRIAVGGYSNTGNYPLFHSNDRGNTWINIGPTPVGTVYSLAQEASTLGTKYAGIRDDNNSANNGLFRYTTSTGWQLRACAGLDIRAVIQNSGTVLAGVNGTGKGIYRSTNTGDVFSQIYNGANIYCFWSQLNTFWAGGNYQAGSGVILKSSGFPFDTWTEIGTVDGIVIGLTVMPNGNIFVSTSQGKIFRSLNNNPFEVCRTGVNWDILKIPIVVTTNGTVYYGDYQNGVYYSTDNGTTWLEYNGGLIQPVHVIDLSIDPCDMNFVYLALGGSLSQHIYYREDFTITTSSNPTNGGATTGDGNYSYNQTATVLATRNSGWTFHNWTENGSVVSTDSSYSFPVTSNRSLVANFTQDTFLIQTQENPVTGGQTTGDGYYLAGTTATVQAFPYTNWGFLYWKEDQAIVCYYPSYSFTVTQERVLTAYFLWIDAVNEINGIYGAGIYPNPASTHTKLSFSVVQKTYVKIELLSAKGVVIRTILEKEVGPGYVEKNIDLSNLRAGLYEVKIRTGNRVQTLKLIVV